MSHCVGHVFHTLLELNITYIKENCFFVNILGLYFNQTSYMTSSVIKGKKIALFINFLIFSFCKFLQKIRTVEQEGKSIKLQIVSRVFAIAILIVCLLNELLILGLSIIVGYCGTRAFPKY